MANLQGVTWSDGTERGKLTRTAAAALKGKALLLWASPQFNPTDNSAHPYDASRWQAAFDACKAAYDIALADGKSLMSSYESIFRTEELPIQRLLLYALIRHLWQSVVTM
ncbi:hypothetical protein LWM68_24445 [Niabella sp. W65]|nr:hypothetical protein [Niabella sp. W65]MCH7365647.1 hypothetical protein [Niabella sp. W65]ULT41421.1 hypothetical protein KRR40_43340 [Niabella sp. I65]